MSTKVYILNKNKGLDGLSGRGSKTGRYLLPPTRLASMQYTIDGPTDRARSDMTMHEWLLNQGVFFNEHLLEDITMQLT